MRAVNFKRARLELTTRTERWNNIIPSLWARITSCIKYLISGIFNNNLRYNIYSACLALKFNERKLASLARFNMIYL